MVRLTWWCLGAVALLIVWVMPVTVCKAQALTGDIVGTVRDSSGAVIPDVRISLTQVDTGIKLSVSTDSSGNYSFAELKPTRYSLEASKLSFTTTTIPDIELLVTQRQRIDVTLRLGAVSQHVEVSAGAAELLETQTSSVGQVIQQKPIVDLPLNGRDFVQLATLSAGVYSSNGAAICSCATWATGAPAGTVSFTAMGLRETDISYLIDGIETRGARLGNVTVRPSPDAIQEFKVQTENYSAENGRSSIIVNVALKSGSNKLHGSAYEFLRNSYLDANNFFLNLAGVQKPGFQQNDFGGSVGGPIRHDKTFFFGDFEGIRSLKAESLVGLYPSVAQFAGNLADDSAGTGIFPTNSSFCQANAGSQKCVDVINPSTGQAFPGNRIPKNMLDPIAQKWLPYIHVPNVAVAANEPQIPSFNFAYTPKELNNADLFHIRLDHVISDKDHFFASYSFDQRPHFRPGLPILGGLKFPWRAQVLALNETHLFSPTIVNEVRFGYNRSVNGGVGQTAYGQNIASNVFGFQNVQAQPVAYGVPGAVIAGVSCIGSDPFASDTYDSNFQFDDNLSIVHGKHSLKMGGAIFHENFLYLCDCEPNPQLAFTGQFSGAGLGDFLLGIPDSSYASVGQGLLNARSNFYAAYLQDDFRPRPDLTLNLGIRYQYQQSPRDVNGHEETFLPSTGQVEAVFRDQIRNGITNPDYRDVSPRIGFAYSPGFLKNTVIRSSAGIFYATGNYNEFGFAAFGPDFIIDQSLVSDPTAPTIPLSSLFPPLTLGIQNQGPSIGIFGVDPSNRTPYTQEWSFDVEHTIGLKWVVDVGYVGNVAQRLQQRRDENTPSFDPTGTIPIANRRPFPYSFILTTYNGGWSSYNGLLTKLERKVTSNGFVLATYSWAKALDIFNAYYETNTSRDFKVYDKGNSLFVPPQKFSISYNYALPIGRGKRYLAGASRVGDRLVSGWVVSGITTFQSGLYTTPALGFDYMNLGPLTTSLPNKVGSVLPAQRSYTDYWNPNAYALPGCPSLNTCPSEVHIQGNTSKGSLENPGVNNWDLSFEKNTRLTEGTSLQFRGEFFNAWNHTQFGGPNSTLNSGIFGQITSVLIPPREIQLALKLLW